MSAPSKFRSAFNGFNREDVVHYLEYLNSKHTAQVNQLTSEADFLRAKLETMQFTENQSDQIAALEAERNELRAQVEALQARCAELEQNPVPPVCSHTEELEVYRRAERTERMARERADMICRQTNIVLGEASVKVNEFTTQVGPLADQILAGLAQLQAAIADGKQSLQDAAIVLSTLRSSDN